MNTPEVEATKKLELEAINAAEAGDLQEALHILNEALLIAPKRASLYNNRAQVHQFLKNYDGNKRNFSLAVFFFFEKYF